MKFWKGALPNISICLNIVTLVVVYLDMRNPMMGFLMGVPFVTLIALTAVSSVATAVVLYAGARKENNKRTKPENLSNKT